MEQEYRCLGGGQPLLQVGDRRVGGLRRRAGAVLMALAGVRSFSASCRYSRVWNGFGAGTWAYATRPGLPPRGDPERLKQGIQMSKGRILGPPADLGVATPQTRPTMNRVTSIMPI